jgi:hypothetical protein
MRTLTPCIVVIAASQLGATDCGGNVTRDPGFDLWCGESLCAWKLERGEIRRVPTWHVDDSGVELLDDTAIEQFTPVNSHDGTCIRFDLISDVAETAQAELGIDIYGDGSVERSYPIPTTHWRPTSYEFAVQTPFTGIRFEIAKRGPGRAVVARMHAVIVKDGCAGLAPLAGGPAPLGAICGGNNDCASAICGPDFFGGGRCAGCDVNAPLCPADQVCGVADPGPPERNVPLACVPRGARELGEWCLGNAECASGLCTFGVCSVCGPLSACGDQCQPSYPHGPFLCSPAQHRGLPGAPCGTADDCASGTCLGPDRLQCLDGRACATDANCPVDANLRPGPCTAVGIQGGSCD